MDKVTRDTTLPVPPERAWAAITDHEAFGTWFRARLDQPFALGTVSQGEVFDGDGNAYPFWVRVTRMDAPEVFAFEWPIVETATPEDPAAGTCTTVTFTLAPHEKGSHLTITEEGFDTLNLPESARADWRRQNARGWEIQCRQLREHLGG